VAIVFAIPRLFDAVVERFALDGTAAMQSMGWRAPAEQVRSGRRIVWIPGDDGGNLGVIAAPKFLGTNPRQIATLLELCTVEIYAYDATASANERAQYQAARELYDAWVRAVELAAHGTYQIVSSKWVGGDRTLRAGASIRVVLALQAPIVDAPVETAPVDTGADIGMHELDVTEPNEIPAPA
jgi:hypothetical protein